MAIVTYDDRSFMVDGRRIWLISGSIHYFRTPHELWRDRLLKAKRAGLNCIDTYVAWNFHEPREGKWDFTGDRDVAAFIRLAGELGLYVILRPGPYICAEWDFGGLPSWLAPKPGIVLRTNNAIYTHYYDKYFRQLLPRLAELQITRGGNIVLIQNENEYYLNTMPDRLSYLEFISQLFRRGGFDIPIINCNWFSDPRLGESVECVNGWDDCVQQLKRMRVRQPNAPLLVTEFWDGWFDYWAAPSHTVRDDRECARRALEIVGCGAQLNYYMWHGGTNFAFWASKLNKNSASYQTTSYDYDAPLAEGGGLTRKYYLTRLVNMLCNHMGQFLAGCAMGEPPTSIHSATNVFNLSGRLGHWAIVTNNGREDAKVVTIALPEGKEMAVSLETFGATAVPIALRLNARFTLDYANLMPLGFFQDRILVLHGPADWQGLVKINGKEYKASIPKEAEPKMLDLGDLKIILVNSELAMRTWSAGDTLVFGPDFVGEDIEQITHAPHGKEYFLLGPDAKIVRKKVPTAGRSKPPKPRMGVWKVIASCPEPDDGKLTWQAIDRPKDLDSQGVHYGYGWYRAEFDSPKAAKRHLFLPQCEDRATIYLNGDLTGTWGWGPGAAREPMAVSVPRGRNVITILADNMGRLNFGESMGGLKGLYGPIFDAEPMKFGKLKLKRLETFAKRIVPRRLAHLTAELEQAPLWSCQLDIPLKTVLPIHIDFADVPHNMAVLCNDRVVGFFTRTSHGAGDITLSSELQKGKNRLELLIWGDVNDQVLEKFHFHALKENLTGQARWSFKHWDIPVFRGEHVVKRTHRPAWFACRFKRPESAEPLFLNLSGKGKGQLFLNGHNIGRYWSVGPQERYYLPACWLTDDNVLMVFDETASGPAKASLEFCPTGPFAK